MPTHDNVYMSHVREMLGGKRTSKGGGKHDRNYTPRKIILRIDDSSGKILIDETIMNKNNKLTERYGKISKMSGYEPQYDPSIWNDNKSVKTTHNCYAYSLNQITKRNGKPQPGYFSGYEHINSKTYNCHEF